MPYSEIGDIKNFLDLNPSEVLAKLPAFPSDDSRFWTWVADGAMNRASHFTEILPDISKQWAYVAIHAFSHLNNKGSKVSEMMLRARMILAHGADAGTPLLDPGIIEEWFFDALPLDRAAAVRISNEFRGGAHVGNQELRQVRDIKNRLAVVMQLEDRRVFRRVEEILLWSSIRRDLI